MKAVGLQPLPPPLHIHPPALSLALVYYELHYIFLLHEPLAIMTTFRLDLFDCLFYWAVVRVHESQLHFNVCLTKSIALIPDWYIYNFLKRQCHKNCVWKMNISHTNVMLLLQRFYRPTGLVLRPYASHWEPKLAHVSRNTVPLNQGYGWSPSMIYYWYIIRF